MAYNYYRTSAPGWGTSQFRFGTPWVPTFQPQPTWSGLDFYNAHAYNPDPAFYNSIMASSSEFASMGLGHSQARRWHDSVYSGMVPLTQLLPTDIGAAAAYEAYRVWRHNSFLYEPLSADRTQQREGLIGLAIAEATKLWQYTGRSFDVYGLRATCQAAAAAASALADRWIARTYGGFGAAASPYMAGSPIPGSPASMGSMGVMGGTPLGGGSPILGAAGGGMLPGTLSATPSPYLGGAALPATQVAPQGSTIVIDRPRSRHSHRHGHHHHHHGHHGHHRRARSVEVIPPGGGYGNYGGGYGGGYGGYGGYGGGYGGYGGGYRGYGGYGGGSGYGGYGSGGYGGYGSGGYGGYGSGGYGGYGGGYGGYGGGGYGVVPGGGLLHNVAAGVRAGFNASGYGRGALYY
ncbi:hypothetical protein C8Q78DRAFT_436753 [Trametes maxima]|nr:hypothetical protein C8Q78DRAFT_436753 [Trametes maxima]